MHKTKKSPKKCKKRSVNFLAWQMVFKHVTLYRCKF